MRVIITGGTGLIGRSLVEELARAHHEIFVLSRTPVAAARAFQRQGMLDVQVVGWDGRTAQGWGELVTRERNRQSRGGEPFPLALDEGVSGTHL